MVYTDPMSDTIAPYLDGLNEAQRLAVETVEGPVLVLAGAGTGKTRVLTTRLAHILATRRAFPSQLLAVTFTNKAAREMQNRLTTMLGPTAEGLWLGTFHSIGARLLRRHAEIVGLKPNFTILDTDDQLRLVKQLLEAEDIDEKRWPARLLLGLFEHWKDRGYVPDTVPEAEQKSDIAGGRAAALYRLYQERLIALNAADFGDLLLHNLTILRSRQDLLAATQQRFRFILVDEYQDTNVAQYLWLRLLAQSHRNLCCVGDDDQSIYSWRGAEIGNILRFEQDFPGARIIRLEENYRSTPNILACASTLIARNVGRLGKTLWTTREAGQPLTLRSLWDSPQEARWVGEEIESLRRDGLALSEIAILVRTTFQMREFEERFIAMGLPYRVIGGPRFYERQEIRDAIAYLRLTHQGDDDLAFERIINTPRRGIGSSSMKTLHAVARAEGLSLSMAAERLITTDEVSAAARRSLNDFLISVSRWRGRAASLKPADLGALILDESGYTRLWQEDKSADAPGRLENLKELVAAMAEFETLQGFLEHVSLVMENAGTDNQERVSLMTLHSAKGLEFDAVFLPGWEEGLFPNQRALEEKGHAALEEERRLAYVGITRARKYGFVSTVANRRIHGQWQAMTPSRFVGELPEDHIRKKAEHGLGPGQWPGQPNILDPSSQLRRLSGPVIAAEQLRPRRREGDGFRLGDRLFHQKFGYGTVRGLDGNRLHVAFDKAGEKLVMDNFVEKA
ncbi:MAG TPA: UvrD-helicase domain-containing protein [Stellaceae bacterium]|nr:UvrD-helicase domain-containing protein [Stellaceae bacterium]